MTELSSKAPGAPGIEPRWTSSAKTGVGTSLSLTSRVWFTISHGILNEIYYPRVDQACTRDLGLIVTDGVDFFSEEKRDAMHQISYLQEGLPAYKLVNTCIQGRYTIEKEIFTDPKRDALLQFIRFSPVRGSLETPHLYVLLAPHLANRGYDNSGWVGEYKGIEMLFAEREGCALALACSALWVKRSVGYVGTSDAWQDIHNHRQMTWQYMEARNGNIALCGEVDLNHAIDGFVLTLGFGQNASEAGHRALASLVDDFDSVRSTYLQEWRDWQNRLSIPDNENPCTKRQFRLSATILRVHEAKRFPGGIIASLSIPWGFAKGDDDLGGYHLVWPRDLVEAAGSLLAIGAHEDARRVLDYLRVTQEIDGHWPQNMWLDGTPYWSGIQMDETAFPILLIDLAFRERALDTKTILQHWPMVRRAAAFIARNGPVTQQDRWEEDAGYSPFTLAVEIAALLIAADIADLKGETEVGVYLRQTADAWNEQIERWTYARESQLALQIGVDGYYVRIAPPDSPEAASPTDGFVPIKNRPPGESSSPAKELISPDALALVRFGLRAPDDPRILNTLKVIDALLQIDTPSGPAWHRYNEDGYGEHEDGLPFDGTGIGRAWPLLTGERAHYELAAGNYERSRSLLSTLHSFANAGGMLPEQIWDAIDIPTRELFFGKPSGSAMPLVWAHAEFLKLVRSLQDKRVFDTPRQTQARYIQEKKESLLMIWRVNNKCLSIPIGKKLRVEVLQPVVILWTSNGWDTFEEVPTIDTSLGLFYADLDTDQLSSDASIVFTFQSPAPEALEGQNFTIQIRSADK